jgi:hypothetical protein
MRACQGHGTQAGAQRAIIHRPWGASVGLFHCIDMVEDSQWRLRVILLKSLLIAPQKTFYQETVWRISVCQVNIERVCQRPDSSLSRVLALK